LKKIVSLILVVLLMLSVFSLQASAAAKPDALVNSLYKLQSGNFTVGYFGGSVTCGTDASNPEKTSWRALTRDWFKSNFPNATVTEVNAAVGATGSNFGIFRADEHLIKNKAPDLCFIEFAVNDLWANAEYLDGKNFQTVYANVEGIIKKIYASNPKSDIVFIITGEISSLKTDATSVSPVFGDKYAELAEYYNLPIIYVGRELVRTVYKENNNSYPQDIKNAVWKKYFDDTVHPNDNGYAHYANTITEYLKSKLLTGYTASSSDYANKHNPEITYCEKNMLGDLYLQADIINNINKLSNCTNNGFTQVDDIMKSTKNGDSIEFDFQSPNVGIWHYGGAKIGIEYSIDGGVTKFHTLHQPDGTHRMFILGSNLSDGTHRIKITRIEGNGNFNIKAIMLSGKPYVGKLSAYNNLPQVDVPRFKLSGVNGGVKKMYISTETSGATIYYTLDGSDPKTSSTKKAYTGAITLKKDLQIKAYAAKSGMRDSSVTVFDYKTYMEGYVVNAGTNDANGFSFTTNAEINNITSIKVDGKFLEKANYTTVKDTKTIILKPEYLQSIGEGKHTLVLFFNDGDAQCSFNYSKNATQDGVSSSEEETVETEEQTDEEKLEKKKSNPLVIGIIAVSATALIAGLAVFFVIKKIYSNDKVNGSEADEEPSDSDDDSESKEN